MYESTVVFMRMLPGQKRRGKPVVKPHDYDRSNRLHLARVYDLRTQPDGDSTTDVLPEDRNA